MLIAGDVGGTKTNLALFSLAQGAHEPLEEARFASADYDSLAEIVHEFLAQTKPETVEAVSVGVPGPVINGRAQITNLPWVIESAELRERLAVPAVYLLNDLVAMANAVPILEPHDLEAINVGSAEQDGAIAVLAPGTGLGQAYLTYDNGHYMAHPSEGGHARFSPSNDSEAGLLQYLMDIYGHVSTERVCSGSGIPNIYRYLRDTSGLVEPAWFVELLAAADDQAPVIINNALSGSPALPLTQATLEMFASILGSEAGDLALTFLATGGVYLGGGIPPRILETLKTDHFWRAFADKGRFAERMQQMPVHVILNSKAPMLGAARVGLEAVRRG